MINLSRNKNICCWLKKVVAKSRARVYSEQQILALLLVFHQAHNLSRNKCARVLPNQPISALHFFNPQQMFFLRVKLITQGEKRETSTKTCNETMLRDKLRVFVSRISPSLVWGNCGKTLSNKLQKLQNRAARVITSSSYDADVNFLFYKLSWKDLNSQCQIQKALMVFKSLNGLVPEYLTSKFVMRNVSNYALRDSANKLVVPFPRTNYMKNSFSYSGATLWNSLHRNIRESSSIDQFKRLLYLNF